LSVAARLRNAGRTDIGLIEPSEQHYYQPLWTLVRGRRRQPRGNRYDLAPKTWDMIRNLKSGTAVFTQPSGAIKCAGAPQKSAGLAADYWRKQGVLRDIRVVMVLPTPGIAPRKSNRPPCW
jgi:NADPH-dependent 2,4-dienoyl-CoA reductase/sulfur reductase-like enzyme